MRTYGREWLGVDCEAVRQTETDSEPVVAVA
jgi:hypothetical protein